MASAGEKPVDKAEFRTSGLASIWKIISNRLPQWCFEVLEVAYNFYSLPTILMGIRKHRPSFLYERYAFFHFSGELSSRLTGVPLILEVNEVSGVKRARKQTFVGLCRHIEKVVFSGAEQIYTVSSFLKDRIKERYGRDDVIVMPNAVDASILGRPTRREEIRSKYGLGEKIVLGFAGWFDEWDRLDILIEVFGVLQRRHDVALLLIGDGKLRASLEAQANALGGGKIVFTGPVGRSEIFDYLDAVDIPVFPHSNDFGSPVVLFEFMSLGKPVVAPETPPLLDVLRNGRNAILFPPLEKGKLIESIDRLIRDGTLRRTLGDRARLDISTRYTWKSNATTILSVLHGKNIISEK